MVETEGKLPAEHFSWTDHETGKADAGEIPRARDSASAPVSGCVHHRTKVKFQGVHTSKVEGYVWSSRLALLFSREELPARSLASGICKTVGDIVHIKKKLPSRNYTSNNTLFSIENILNFRFKGWVLQNLSHF